MKDEKGFNTAADIEQRQKLWDGMSEHYNLSEGERKAFFAGMLVATQSLHKMSNRARDMEHMKSLMLTQGGIVHEELL